MAPQTAQRKLIACKIKFLFDFLFKMLISIGSIPFISHMFKALSRAFILLRPKFFIPLSLNANGALTVAFFTVNPSFYETGHLQTILLFFGSASLGVQAILGRKHLHILDYFIKVFFSMALFFLAIISKLYSRQLGEIVSFCNRLCSFERTFIHFKATPNQTGKR